VIQYGVSAENVDHYEDCRFLKVMMDFINNGAVSSISQYPVCEKASKGAMTMHVKLGVIIVSIAAIFAT
jgi:hypothetical protein